MTHTLAALPLCFPAVPGIKALIALAVSLAGQ